MPAPTSSSRSRAWIIILGRRASPSPALEIKDGTVRHPDGPGWGVEIEPDWLAKAEYHKSEAG